MAKEQKYDQAIRTFEKAVEKKPARAEAYAGLAAVYNAQEDLDRAEMVFWDAIEANPTSVELYEEMIDFILPQIRRHRFRSFLMSVRMKVFLLR